MNVQQFEDDLMQLRHLHLAIEGLAYSSETIAEMHGHEEFFAAMAFLVDEASSRVDRLEKLFELGLEMQRKLLKNQIRGESMTTPQNDTQRALGAILALDGMIGDMDRLIETHGQAHFRDAAKRLLDEARYAVYSMDVDLQALRSRLGEFDPETLKGMDGEDEL